MASKEIIDQATRHQVLVQLYGEGQAKQIAADVNGVFAEVGRIIGAQDLSSMPKAQLNRVYRDIDKAVRAQYAEIATAQIKQLDFFGTGEYEISRQVLEANVTTAVIAHQVSETFVDTLMNVRPGVQITIGEALAEFGRKKAREITRAIADGTTQGLTSQAIAGNISNLAPMQQRQAGTLVRTMVNAVSTQARLDLYQDNADILEGYEWVSTLDSRTSLICAGRDGKVYPLNSKIKPPAHFGCRSTMVAKIKPEYDLLPEGARPSVGATGAEQVSATTNYGQWLKRQPAAFQDAALGDNRAALFRRGGLSIESFTTQRGRVLSIDELRASYPLAFAKANL